MPEPDRALLLDAARAAGEIALRHFGRAPEVWDKGGGAGPVSAADLEVDRMLRAELVAARPGYGWLSEESVDNPDRLACERVFIVDPIDGTRAFIAGESAWSHSLAIAEHGRVIAAVVHLPKLDRTYEAARGEAAWQDGRRLAPSRREEMEGAQVLASAAQMAPGKWPSGVPAVERHFRPSLAYRLCLVAEGRFDAMLNLRNTWEWDVAAGDLIASEAGARVTTWDGEAPVYNRARPWLPGMIAAPPALHAALVAKGRGGFDLERERMMPG